MSTKITTVTNDDGTTGIITNANKYLLSDDYLQKYKLLQALSKKNKQATNSKKLINVGGTKVGKDAKVSTETYSTSHPGILHFLTKLQKFQYAPPSDNLWTVEITSQETPQPKTNGLVTLYKSITNINESWQKSIQSKWKVSLENPKKKNSTVDQNYIAQFAQQSGIFLAQNINFTPHSVTTSESVFPQGTQHSAFLNFGYFTQNRQINRSLKISFLVSNWDIGDILFDPWIAAVGQHGLIEDGSTGVKSKIIIKEYSAGIDSAKNNKVSPTSMYCRKQYIFHNCVPVNRGSVEKKYDFNDAGTFKLSVVQFKYDDYEIQYLI